MDYFGKDTSELKNKKLFLFDMDGTIYNENKVFGGTNELLNYIINIGGRYVFITNNSSKSVNDYVLKLNKLGIKSDKENFFTSSQASILYIKENYPNAKVYCQGTKSFIEELKKACINVTENDEEDINVVLVGFDTEYTTKKVETTCKILQEKNPVFIATNPDLRCPVSFGFVPDCGSICQLITNVTNKKPIFLGKPNSTMVDFVRNKFNYSKEETCVIGDRLYTDIATGINAGVTSICVLTGEATINEINNGNIKPTFTFESVKELFNDIKIKDRIQNI